MLCSTSDHDQVLGVPYTCTNGYTYGGVERIPKGILGIKDTDINYMLIHVFLFRITLGLKVTTVNATDRDSGLNSKLVYELTTPDQRFQIDSSSGVVSVTGSGSFEAGEDYSLDVTVYDSGEPQLSSLETASIQVYEYISRATTFLTEIITLLYIQ